MVINQGDIFWVDFGVPDGSASGYSRPAVVIQNDLFNVGRIGTTVVCLLTSNLKHAAAPGNVLLKKGEGNLPKQSVVNVSQMFTVDKVTLTEYIGTLSDNRVWQIFDGVQLVTKPSIATNRGER
ncbi:MAG TPA: type II toxin-antitoxin system PemK/MazF family toxin [Anaerolineae bacterium]|nr:type II toxin-antitoxin system PemK/MazF family toxin [Anaerolineae bacterium]